VKIRKSELKQLIKEEIEATLDEGMFDFITGGSFDAEAFKRAASELLSRGRLPQPRKGEDPERVAEQTGPFIEGFMDDPSSFIEALEGGIEKAVFLVFKQAKFMRASLRDVVASLRSGDLKRILPRGAYKDWKRERPNNKFGLGDFSASSDADYDEWIQEHSDVADAISKVVATIMAEYYHNAFYGSESEYGTGGKEEEAFLGSLSERGRQLFSDIKALMYYPRLQGTGNGVSPRNLSRANRYAAESGNSLADGIAREIVSTKELEEIKRLMKDAGYDKTNPDLYKNIENFDYRDIADKIRRY
jgi:hypothetical protein